MGKHEIRFFVSSVFIFLLINTHLYAQTDTLKIMPGHGTVGSSGNIVPIYLANSVEVAGIQFTIGDDNEFLWLEDVATTPRTQGFNLAYKDNRVLLYDLVGKNIAAGKGPILYLYVKVAEYANEQVETLRFLQHPILSNPKAKAIQNIATIPAKFTIEAATKVELIVVMPNKYELEQNYPNPFNGFTNAGYGTRIGFSIREKGHVKIRLFDLLGKQVATIVDRDYEQGKYSVQFDAKGLRSGIYIYKMDVNGFSISRKMVIVR